MQRQNLLASGFRADDSVQVPKEIEQAGLTGREVMVWGSSVGWLVFYSALSLGLESSGTSVFC